MALLSAAFNNFRRDRRSDARVLRAATDRQTERQLVQPSVALRQPKNSSAPRCMRIVSPADKERLSDLDVRAVSKAAGGHVYDAQLPLMSLMRTRYQMR